MGNVSILKEYGLFDAKVPRYTSYPPANRFEPDTGAQVQGRWLADLPDDVPVSVYVHIPFCRRLCWFCACRTQGTQTMKPVEAYIDDLVEEIRLVAAHRSPLPAMARLHLGGGTPTLLDVGQMSRLLDAVDASFARAENFEFSVEIDPTEAALEVLALLAQRGMGRASIGVQDFDPQVQEAIGRRQSFAQTRKVVDHLRRNGVTSLNIDLLYGLPFQTLETLHTTLDQVQTLSPDRLALYGYAHVPHMSRRQVMIPDDILPGTVERYQASSAARNRLKAAGYIPIGIDHFALGSDSLAIAARSGRLKRNFQGYTDDPCATLIGFGASAISKFPQGFVQNAVATAAYQVRIREGRLAGQKGYVMTAQEQLISDLVDQVMCQGGIDVQELLDRHRCFATKVLRIVAELQDSFPQAFDAGNGKLIFRPGMETLARIVAARADSALQSQHIHSAAI